MKKIDEKQDDHDAVRNVDILIRNRRESLQQEGIRSMDIVGGLTEKYLPDKEIAKLFKEKMFYGRSEDDARLERALEGNGISSAVETIKVFETKEFSIDSEEEKLLSTNNLRGCLVSVVVSEELDGRRVVQFAHHPPIGKDLPISERHLQDIKGFVGRMGSNVKNIFFFAARKRLRDPRILEGAVKDAAGGADIKIKIETYMNDPVREDDGTLLIKMPSKTTKEGESDRLLTFYSWEKNGGID